MDQFLKNCRLVRRRAEAHALCAEGALLVNGRPAKPGREVGAGDEVELRTWRKVLRLRVAALPRKGASREEARECCRVLEERLIAPEAASGGGEEGEMDFLRRR